MEDEKNGAGGRNGRNCGEPEGETLEEGGIKKKKREAKLRRERKNEGVGKEKGREGERMGGKSDDEERKKT